MAHGEDAVPDPIRRQVAEHVAATVPNARIPAAERDDVAEELAAHLGEAYRANVAQGMPPDDAMHHALAAFGRAELLSREFMVTYRGRLWASTIGQLLPVIGREDQAPGIVRWLARFDLVMAVFTALTAAAFLLTETPTRAIIGGILGACSALILGLAATAIRRGQSWAVAVSAFLCLVNALIFFALLGQPPGGWTVSLNGLAGVILLLGVWGNLGVLAGWTARSGRI
jgi:hypothetical protein